MYEPERLARLRSAAVLILESQGRTPSLLMVKRAVHLRSHAGEVGFPGGQFEPEDENLVATAIREAYEEVGLDARKIAIRHVMAIRQTRKGMSVTPVVASLTHTQILSAQDEEIDEVFWLPISVLKEDQRVGTHIFQLDDREYWAPIYRFGRYTIWGFTARLAADYVNRFHGAQIGRMHSSPEIYFND